MEDRLKVFGINKLVGTPFDRRRIAKSYDIDSDSFYYGKCIKLYQICESWFITKPCEKHLIDHSAYTDKQNICDKKQCCCCKCPYK